MALRVGIDVGGTFTDVTGFDDKRTQIVLTRKYLSDPERPMQVMSQIARDMAAEFGPDAVSLVLHGSTAALNVLLEDKGVKVGLLTTAGFRDVYEIGRQWRGKDVFNIFAPAPKMLLERRAVREVSERLDAQGNVIVPLNRADVERGVQELLAQNVEAIAVAFLFSYANPAHEKEAGEIIQALAPTVYVSLSSEVNPEWREYERTASTVANGYIGPPVARYVQDLENLFTAQFSNCRPLMMKSDGGAGSAAMLYRRPIQTVMSGPVAGVVGSRYLGALKRIDNIISFDAGGTSSDMAVIPGEPLFKSEINVGRHPLRTQTVDIETIGAGGGSIASVALGGVLKVGPQSAGARPGPACYDRGGSEPTLTDALVILGHLSQTALLQGAMPISKEKAWQAVRDKIAAPLGMTEIEAAWGILRVLVTNCVSAMHTITVERGYDPRDFTLVPFGGMGPTIAGLVAGELEVPSILVPRDPGTFSAWGMLVTDVRQERSLTRLTRLDEDVPQTIEQLFGGLEADVRGDLARERFTAEQINTQRFAGMRYRGQSYEVVVPVSRVATEDDIADLRQRFHESHLRRYGHKAEEEAIEIVNFKVSGSGVIAKPTLTPLAADGSAPATPIERRPAYFGGAGPTETPVFRRAELAPGTQIEGPAIIEEPTSTVVIYPGQRARVDEYLSLEVDVRKT
jgi:N-methylhydantoinase A